MFIAREKELELLERLHGSEKFEFLVMYGRRRVGKTSLLKEFARKEKVIFFSAQEKNDALNLEGFSRTVQTSLNGKPFGTFSDWQSAFSYITNQAGQERLTVIIDEFPFIAGENPSVKSALQHTIDHEWSESNIFLVLCGSSVSFMENEVMGYKSPLYGRRTAQLDLQPFDYLDSAKFFPSYGGLDKLLAYGILGGVPCYLRAFDDKKSLRENIAGEILRTGAFLKDEPQLLLKMELREPAVYNSIFEAIAGGASRMNEISGKIHEESQKCARYLATLRSIRLVEKITPCGEDESSKRSLYRIADNYYSFWYRYIFSNRSYYELMDESEAADEILAELPQYMGGIFEQVCQQYMLRLAKAKKLPFVPSSIGRWWGTNAAKRRQDDIDILLLDKPGESAVFCECKFRNEPFDLKKYQDLLSASEIFTKPQNRYYYLFSKSGFTGAVKQKATQDGAVLVGLDDLFSDS